MKDIFCVAAFVGKLLGLAVFVSILQPQRAGTVQPPMGPAYCRLERAGTQGCGLNKLATDSGADAGLCGAPPSSATC